MNNIRNFVKSGAYKTADGKFVQGVESNRSFLGNRVFASVLKELRAIQSTGAASTKTAPATKQTSGNQPTTQTTGQQPNQPAANSPQQGGAQTPAQQTNAPKINSVDDFAAATARSVKAQVADEKATRQVASGK
jgi:hypothetical protein